MTSVCAVCASSNTVSLTKKDNYAFSQCKECDFVFLDPMLTQDELNTQYTNRDREAEPTYDKAGSRLRRAYLKLPRFFPYAYRQDVLDLGCGGGFIAHVLSHVAASSTGIDISENAVAYARRHFKRPVFLCNSFIELLKTDRRYGFIYSSEVIEHVSDVNLYMRVLQHLTRPGGYVYITTPDLGHPRTPVDIKEWDVFVPPVHVQFFTPKTVTCLFKRYGFKIIKFYRNRKPGLIFIAKKL